MFSFNSYQQQPQQHPPPSHPPPSEPINPYFQPPYMNAATHFIWAPDPRLLCTPTTPEGRADRHRLLTQSTLPQLPPGMYLPYQPPPCHMFGLINGKTPEQLEEMRKEAEKAQNGNAQPQVAAQGGNVGAQGFGAVGGVYGGGQGFGPLAPLPQMWQDPTRPSTLPGDYWAYGNRGQGI